MKGRGRRRQPSLPSGTVTFCFTDIEGSTRLLQTLGPGWPAVLDRHRSVVRSAIAAHPAAEIGTEGDSFFIAFQTADAAVTAALRIHADLAAVDWPPAGAVKVRIGLDTDTAFPLDDSYVALGVHRAARIQAAGHGGQLLVSRDTLDALSPRVREALLATSLGSFRLKDITDPVQLIDLAAEPWPAGPPTPRAAVAFRSQLPRPRDSFVGRGEEVERVSALLRESSLVTLTGPGGAGKTRLAVEVATVVSGHLDGPTWFVDLTGIDDPARVVSVVATAIGLRQDSEAATVLLVAEHLETTSGLLVLDSCEHVLDAVADVVEEVLTTARGMQLLCTSREALDVRGETRWAVRPLALPSRAAFEGDGELAPAAALFLDRARRVDPGLVVTAAVAAAVAVLCRQLDGLPLALELAAARIATVPIVDLPSLLESQLDSLSSGDRRRDDRHGTLGRVLESSVATLTPAQRDALAALSVFRGGAGLAAITLVLDTPDARQLLDDLVRRSLVEVDSSEDTATGETRWRLLETIRFHAAGLVADPVVLGERHASWVLDFARQVDVGYGTAGQAAWADRVTVEQSNVAAAFAWLAGRDRERSLQLAATLTETMVTIGLGAQAREMLRRGLDDAGPPTRARAHAEVLLGKHLTMHLVRGGEGLALLHSGLATARALGDDALVLRALVATADEARQASRSAEAVELLQQAVDTARRLGLAKVEANALSVLSLLVSEEADDDEALQLALRARAIAEAAGERRVAAVSAHAVSYTAGCIGDVERAREGAEAGLRAFTELGDRWGAMLCLAALSCAERTEGLLPWAALHLDEAFELMATLGTTAVGPQLLLYAAVIVAADGAGEDARHLMAAAGALRRLQLDPAGRDERTCEAEVLRLAPGRVDDPGDVEPTVVVARARQHLARIASPLTMLAPVDHG